MERNKRRWITPLCCAALTLCFVSGAAAEEGPAHFDETGANVALPAGYLAPLVKKLEAGELCAGEPPPDAALRGALHEENGALRDALNACNGAVTVRGVEPGDPQLARLSYKKELRRGILHYCHSFRDSFNEDAEMQAEFRTAGFSNLLIEEVRFHMWYLRHKDYLCLQTPSIGGDVVFMAKITAAGVDVVEQAKKDPGITHDAD